MRPLPFQRCLFSLVTQTALSPRSLSPASACPFIKLQQCDLIIAAV